MREILILPAFTASHRRISILAGLVLMLFFALGSAGCGVKKQTKVEVPEKILQAKAATLDELLGIINRYSNITDLSCNPIRLTLTLGKVDSEVLDKYKKARGYILLRRPDSIRLVIQEPIIKTALADLVSVRDDFSIFIRRDNKFYKGKNSAEELVIEDAPDSPEIPIRPKDLFEALLPKKVNLNSLGIHISIEEDIDAEAKYYVLSVIKVAASPRVRILRRIWIERSRLEIARQRLFGEEGQIIGDITYSNMELRDGYSLPKEIYMNRPQEGYAFEIELDSKRCKINAGLKDKAFILEPPEGSQVIQLREKGRSDAL
jgi:hypothetical protein